VSQFRRRVRLEIQRKGAATSRVLDGLRTQATTRRSLTDTPDASIVTMYGASPESAQDLQQPGTIVRLLAGYADAGTLGVLIAGTVQTSTLTIDRMAGEVVTSLQVVDSRVQVRAAAVSRSWDQTTATEVATWAIGAAGLATGTIRLGREVTYATGYAAVGVIGDVLREIATDTESALVIQDGVVSLFPAGEARRPTSLLLSPDSGLIGSPRRVDGGRVEAVCLLAPTLRPGDGYRVQGVGLSGDYRAIDVRHEVDSQEGPFFTTVTGARLG
jgi:hypothetical protein